MADILTFTGLLNVVLAVTLLLLITVILQKERPEDADNLDRVLLILFGLFFGGSLLISGVLVMAGAANGIRIEEFSTEAYVTNIMKFLAVVSGWIKIGRTMLNNTRK